MICHRCVNSYLGKCNNGYNKTDDQIREERFNCFKERFLSISNENSINKLYGEELSEEEINNIKRMVKVVFLKKLK